MKNRIKPPAINRLELNFNAYEIGQIKRYFAPPPDRLLEASKAVLDWYDTDGSVGGLYEPIEALRKTIEAQGKDVQT